MIDQATTIQLTIREAAQRLGVSELTIRRRIKKGELEASKVTTPQGFTWRVSLPGDVLLEDEQEHITDSSNDEVATSLHASLNRQDDTITHLHGQLAEKDKQIEQLHILLKQSQDRMLSAPKEHDPRPWWMRLLGIQAVTSTTE